VTKAIRLVIFDLDGTLVDSSVDITNALNYALGPFGFKKMTAGETIGLVGEGLSRLIEKVVGNEKAAIIPQVQDRFIRYYSEHLADFTVPYNGVRETLQRLGDIKKAVISNKRESLSKNLLEKLRLASFFDIILGSDSVVHKKPSPEPVLKVLDALGVRPEETVIVGDSGYDIDAGKAASVKTIAVSYGFRDRKFLGSADRIIDSIEELIPILLEMNSDA